MSTPGASDGRAGRSVPGRLTREAALALLERGGELLASGDFAEAAGHYGRVVGFDDPAITGGGAARPRRGSLPAERRAGGARRPGPPSSSSPRTRRPTPPGATSRPPGSATATCAARSTPTARPTVGRPHEDKAEIANRLGWLTKETGDTRAAGRYFARARGDGPPVTATWSIIAITSIVSLTAMFSADGAGDLRRFLQLDKLAVADGEYWRLWTVTLLHGDLLHLFFNMYALFLVGTIVERWYGSIRFVAFYLACAAAGSMASFVFGGDIPSVGASGAVFGLFGVLLAAGRLHHPVDRQSRGIVSQLGVLIIINIVFGFASAGQIDNAAHLGGLAAGLWLGALVPPTRVATLSSLWQRPAGSGAGAGLATAPGYVLYLGLAVVGIVVAAGIVVGTAERSAAGPVHPLAEVVGYSAPARPRAGRSSEAGSDGSIDQAGVSRTDHPTTATSGSRLTSLGGSGKRRGDGRLVGLEAVRLADDAHQARPAHPVTDRASNLGEAELDPGLPQVGVRARSACRSSPRRGRPSPRCPCTTARGGSGRGTDERHDLVLRDIGVDERQRHVRTEDQDPGDGLGVGCRPTSAKTGGSPGSAPARRCTAGWPGTGWPAGTGSPRSPSRSGRS